MLTAALRYAERGLRVLPVDAKTKRPRLVKHGCLDATTDHNLLATWWRLAPDAGVGIATGSGSGIVVVDVDSHRDGDNGLAEISDELGQLPPGPIVTTPRGGHHRYLRLPDGERVPCSVDRLAPGIDVRGDGGYVVAPPTAGYRWAPSSRTGLPVLPDEWASRMRPSAASGTPERLPASTWTLPLARGIEQGGRHDFMVRYCGHLLACRLEPAEVRLLLESVNRTRVRPALPDREIAQIVEWAARRQASRQRPSGSPDPEGQAKSGSQDPGFAARDRSAA